MARRGMPFCTYSRIRLFGLLICLVIVLLLIRITPWFQTLQVTDVDHGPSADGLFIPVTITTFYEALCPDSKNFVIKQLRPVVEKAPRLVTTVFVPYGKAKTKEDSSKNITFECQHGPTECFANKIHSCAVNIINDQSTQVQYVACMISDNYDPIKAGKTCSRKINVEWEPIERCSLSNEGNILLKKNGELTHDLRPSVSFIPTILLDDSQANQARILKNLFKEVCSHFTVLPEECKVDQSTS